MAVPKIRFPGFTEDWEQHKCCDLLAMLKDGTHGTHKDADNGPYLLSAKNIKDGHIIIDETTDRKISISEFEQIHSKFKLQKGDVLLTIVGSIGESAILENPSNLTFQRSVAFLRPNSTVTSSFLRTTIESSGFQKELQDRKSQSAQPGVYLGELEKIPVSVPSLKEQEQIGSFFTELDDIITLHQRKLESMKLLKKSLLQKMFPKSGETVPEVRFPGFTDAWEQRKVSELLEERNEQAPESSDYPLMAFIANIGVAPKGERYDRGALVKDAENKLYKRTEIGDFIYSSNNLETGSIGLNNYGNACISPVYSIFKPTGIADSDFIGRRFIRKDFINSMVKWRQGVVYGQWKIHESDFMKIQVAVPSLEEQRKIGEFLSSLDNLITLHQRKVEALQKLKKSLLQQMFV